MNVDPILWGADLWDSLFLCTWHCEDPPKMTLLRVLLFECLPLILPCAKCRSTYMESSRYADKIYAKKKQELMNAKLNTIDNNIMHQIKAHDNNKNWAQCLLWLWALKDAVNRKLNKKSITFEALLTRYGFRRSRVNEMTFKDCIVFISLSLVNENCNLRHLSFIKMCYIFSQLLTSLPNEVRENLNPCNWETSQFCYSIKSDPLKSSPKLSSSQSSQMYVNMFLKANASNFILEVESIKRAMLQFISPENSFQNYMKLMSPS